MFGTYVDCKDIYENNAKFCSIVDKNFNSTIVEHYNLIKKELDY